MVTIFFKTYGCQANVADSQGLITYLEGLGCRKVAAERNADLIVVNTCAIREKAEQKMFSYLGELVYYKRQRPFMHVGVIGCTASYRKKEIYKRFDHVNFVSGARDDTATLQTYLFDLITKIESTKQLYYQDQEKILSSGQDRDIKATVRATDSGLDQSQEVAASTRLGGVVAKNCEVRRSFVNITTGCNNYCTYCIVPFTRGRETSYSLNSIVERVKKDVEQGAKEVNLIGQNVNSYQCPETGKRFAHLLEAVARIKGDFWVRYVSPHPKDMTPDVLQTMASYPDKLCAWVHFPLQSGSDPVLEAMKRTYTAQDYLEQVDMIRATLPSVSISTDIIVGFPGETEQDYQATRSVMEQVKFDFTFSFIYSPRKYTKAYRLEDTCEPSVKKKRLELLQARQKEICFEQNKKHVGQRRKVLIEKRLSHGRLLARTEGNIRVLLEGDDQHIGSFEYVVIQRAGIVNLEGVLI